MALFTEGFPVCLIPEQPLVTTMRNDVIHHRRGDDLALCLTESTQRTLLQKQFPGFLPSGVISPSGSAAALAFTAPHDKELFSKFSYKRDKFPELNRYISDWIDKFPSLGYAELLLGAKMSR